jgi:glutamate decarboxylase
VVIVRSVAVVQERHRRAGGGGANEAACTSTPSSCRRATERRPCSSLAQGGHKHGLAGQPRQLHGRHRPAAGRLLERVARMIHLAGARTCDTRANCTHSTWPTTATLGRLACTPELTREQIERLETIYGNRFLLEPAPDNKLPKSGMTAEEAMRLVERGDGARRPADAQSRDLRDHLDGARGQSLIAENLHVNFIDHAEYPQTAEIEQRCIRMLADLFNAPGETTGARTQGSSEAIMLGALSLKWKWRARRKRRASPTDRPNLVFGGDVHVVWEKFCRYFDVEPRIVPLKPDKYTIGPEDVEPHIDENTIGVAAVLGTTFTGHADDIRGINDYLVTLKHDRDLDVPLHVDAASGGFVWPFLYPHSEWDFRLEQVRSINVSGHKFGLVYPGIGWLVFRERSDLPEDLVFYENYLGKRDATFTLNFSTGSAMVLAQYYNFVRLGHDGYRYVMETMQVQRAHAVRKRSRRSASSR